MAGDDRASKPGEVPVAPVLTEEEVARVEGRNGLRQFDRMIELIDAAVAPSAPKFRLRPSVVMDLNRIAVDGLMSAPGSYRQASITISGAKHQPPPAEEVARHMDDMCEYVQDNWGATPVHLAAYVMWRLNWIHPFRDGNGRTSRAATYLVLCARLAMRLPGTKTIPERIAAEKPPYYAALENADAAWSHGKVDVQSMEKLLGAHLAAQLLEIHEAATGKKAADGLPSPG
jgi:Fic family protein